MTTATEKIVENKLLTVLARASMLLAAPLMATMLGTVGWYFSGQAEAAAAIQERFVRVETVQSSHGQDIALLKQADANDQARRDRDQADIKVQLDRLQASVSQLSNTVSALTAVLEAQQRASSR